jgi:hypothetical protein
MTEGPSGLVLIKMDLPIGFFVPCSYEYSLRTYPNSERQRHRLHVPELLLLGMMNTANFLSWVGCRFFAYRITACLDTGEVRVDSCFRGVPAINTR